MSIRGQLPDASSWLRVMISLVVAFVNIHCTNWRQHARSTKSVPKIIPAITRIPGCLDIAAGMASLTAAVVGTILFGRLLLKMFNP